MAMLTVGNPMGRVFRLLESAPVPVYDRPDPKSSILARLMPESLLVVFDDPGPYHQVNTADQIFGYIPSKVKLSAVDMLPAELYDPKARAVAERNLTPLRVPAAPGPAVTVKQFVIAIALGLVLFTGMLFFLMRFSG